MVVIDKLTPPRAAFYLLLRIRQVGVAIPARRCSRSFVFGFCVGPLHFILYERDVGGFFSQICVRADC